MAYLKVQVTDQISFTTLPAFMDAILSETNHSTVSNELKKINTIEQINKKSYYLSNLYYTNDETLLAPGNMAILNSLADMMTVHPDIRFKLISHSNIDNQPIFSLFLGMKRAEKMVENLEKKGIDRSRFELISYGPSYPMTKSKTQDKYNNRIEIKPAKYDANRAEIIEEKPKIIDDVRSPLYDTYLQSQSGLHYRIKIATTSQVLKYETLNFVPELMMIKNEQDQYDYYIGYAVNMKDARKQKIDAIQQSYPFATITAFYYGKKIQVDEAALLLDAVPELKEYIDFNDK
jgi:outer membrane protein OmpA-like peptidoglycan-associated protein